MSNARQPLYLGEIKWGDPIVIGDDVAFIPQRIDGRHTEIARLIAAAPDLLDACCKALYALKGREHDQFLRNAIEKATGEKP